MSTTPTTSTTVESRYVVRRAQRGTAGRRGPLLWVSRGRYGLVCRRKDDAVASGRSAVSQRTVKTGPASRRRRSGYGKLSTSMFWPQQCQPNCHESRFRVLQDLESDDHRSGASAGHPSVAQRRPRKTALLQVSACFNQSESCCRKQYDDTCVTWRGARGRTETRRTVRRPCATRSAARRPSATRSDVRGVPCPGVLRE